MLYLSELSRMIEVAKLAASLVLKYYKNGFHVEIKSDDSPVTEADKESDKLIRDYLKKYFPNYAFLTEEEKDDLSRLENDFVFIVDPLDGTKDFVEYDDEFSVNIALCYKHEIVASVIAIPVYNLIYYSLKGYGSYKLDLNLNQTSKIFTSNKLSDLTVLKSRYHSIKEEMDEVKKHQDLIKEVKTAGSAYKACLIAEGKAEISYRLSLGTKEWDTAAFTLLIKEAGGEVLDLKKNEILYNRKDVKNGYYIIVSNIKNFLYD